MSSFPDPQPFEFWATTKGRTVEILARDEVEEPFGGTVDVIAYQFRGGSMVHLRSVDSLQGWVKVVFE